jgi:protoheme IX farnesyltransferase
MERLSGHRKRVATPMRFAFMADLANLTKLRISLVLVFVMVATMFVAGGPVDIVTTVLVSIICLLATTGASVLNNYHDADIDAIMTRTHGRPLPSGRITPMWALGLGVALSVASFGLSVTFMPVLITLLVFAGWFHYVVVYTLMLKRRTVMNIVLGGWAGAYAPLIGWVMVRPLGPAPILLALTIFLWTPIHFWSLSIGYTLDYRKAKLPMLPVVMGRDKASRYILYSAVPLLATLILLPWSGMIVSPMVVMPVSIFVGVALFVWCLGLYKDPVATKGLSLYRRSNMAMGLLFLSLAATGLLQ